MNVQEAYSRISLALLLGRVPEHTAKAKSGRRAATAGGLRALVDRTDRLRVSRVHLDKPRELDVRSGLPATDNQRHGLQVHQQLQRSKLRKRAGNPIVPCGTNVAGQTLTQRQKSIISMIAQSYTRKRIAAFYRIAVKSVDETIMAISRKRVGPGRFSEARWTLWAINNGYAPRPEPFIALPRITSGLPWGWLDGRIGELI